jgi:hypothetical protein
VAFYPRRTWTGLRRQPVSVSFVCADVSTGLAPGLCLRDVLPLRTLNDGARGFLPGVPLECLDTGIVTFEAPAHARSVELTNPVH